MLNSAYILEAGLKTSASFWQSKPHASTSTAYCQMLTMRLTRQISKMMTTSAVRREKEHIRLHSR